ncbi:MAG: hypothetical protein HKN32_02865, partial [Flavobacteriales bacterium]|nr:hypothetical protein [Flavobacteriales bacterium]
FEGPFEVNELTSNITGLITGRFTRVENPDATDQWLSTVSIYNDRALPIQLISHNYLGGIDIENFRYDFIGNMTHKSLFREVPGQPDLQFISRYEFDGGERVRAIYHQVNDNPEKQLVRYEYNELGQMVESQLGVASGFDGPPSDVDQNSLQSVDYSYNIRGWSTHINNADLINDRLFTAESKAEKQQLAKACTQSVIQKMKSQPVELIASLNNSIASGTVQSIDSTPLGLLCLNGGNVSVQSSSLSQIEGNTAAAKFSCAEDLLVEDLLTLGISNANTIGSLVYQLIDLLMEQNGNLYFNDDDHDIWGMELLYSDYTPVVNGSSSFDGTIAETHWKDANSEVKNAYGFMYDQHNRLINADFSNQTDGEWNASGRYNVSNIEYDANGNLQSINRYGIHVDSNSGLTTPGMIDILELGYESGTNQVSQVEDLALLNGFYDFKNGISEEAEYVYDVNANLIEDLNKGIQLEYDHQNYVSKIIWDDGRTLDYVRAFDGRKLEKVVT